MACPLLSCWNWVSSRPDSGQATSNPPYVRRSPRMHWRMALALIIALGVLAVSIAVLWRG